MAKKKETKKQKKKRTQTQIIQFYKFLEKFVNDRKYLFILIGALISLITFTVEKTDLLLLSVSAAIIIALLTLILFVDIYSIDEKNWFFIYFKWVISLFLLAFIEIVIISSIPKFPIWLGVLVIVITAFITACTQGIIFGK